MSLSSSEVELHGIGSAISQGLGVQAICNDLGFDYDVQVHFDATAAIGIAIRRGLGKLRQLDCTDLWVQEKVKSGSVKLAKILGTENVADLGTKHMTKKVVMDLMDSRAVRSRGGRSALVLKASGEA